MDKQFLVLFGHVTKDSEILITKEGGKKYLRFNLAINGAQKEDKTTYYSCLIFGEKIAEIAQSKIKKGTRVMVQGRPEPEAYVNKDGEAVPSVTVLVDEWAVA